MRILIYGINYRPELTSTGKYTSEMAEWLVSQKHEVRVVTAPPYYPSWKVEKGYSAHRYRREYLRCISVWRCPLWVPSKPTGLKRLLHLASFALSSFPVMIIQIFWKPDVVITIEPTLFCAPQALLTAYLSRAKSWLHIQDFEVEVFFGLGFTSARFLKNIIEWAETLIMHRFDHISTISRTMRNRILRLNVSEDRTSIFPNWVHTEHICPNPEGPDLKEEWGFSSEQKIILYAGNMGKKQGLEIILSSAEVLSRSHPDALFLMVGEGSEKYKLIKEAEKRSLKNVIFKTILPVQDLPVLLALADIHLVIQKRGAADAFLPSKLTGIFAAGGYAIITADRNTEIGRLVSENPGIAVLVEPENQEALVKTISGMLESSEPIEEFNFVARAHAELYLAMDIILHNFEEKLFAMLNKK